MNGHDHRLGDFFTSRRERGEDGLPTLSVTLDRGLIPRDSLDRKTETNLTAHEHLRVRPGDIVYNMMRMWQGASGLASEEALVSPAYVVLAPRKTIDPLYASYLFKHPEMIHRFWAYSYGLTEDRLRLYFNDFKRIPCAIPPLPEQRKIAEILSTWDRAIETTEALLAAAKAQKRALMQTLLTGKRRFPEFEGQPWREVWLGHLCDVNPRLTTIANDDRLTFLSMDAVSEEGRILRRDEGTTSQYGTGYTRFQDGDVLVAKITPCFENGKGCHATGLINGLGAGSTEFHVLRAKDERDQRFVFQVVNSHPFRTRGEANMQGSAGQRRVPTDFIRAYLVHAPASADERGRIAEVLDEADRLAEEHKTQIEKLRTEKSALMQQLLTGKRRVRV